MVRHIKPVSRETVIARLREGSDALGLSMSQPQQESLVEYVELLHKWNGVYNLTAVRDPIEMVTVHLLDSMAAFPVVRDVMEASNGDSLLDIGAGAGLPGIVLAVLGPQLQVTLVDAVQKKVAFMTQAIGQLKLRNVRAVHGRIEQLSLPAFDAAISRAFSDLDLFVGLASPKLKESGTLLAMQGKADDRCLSPFTRSLLYPLNVPGLDAQRHLLVLDQKKD